MKQNSKLLSDIWDFKQCNNVFRKRGFTWTKRTNRTIRTTRHSRTDGA